MTQVRREIRRQGLGVSAGIAFGRAYLIGRDTLKAPRHHIEPDDVDTEVARLYKAIAASDRQLAKIKEKLASENESDYHIITAHQMMLHDEHLVGAAVGYIRDELINAEWALRRAVDDIRAVFDQIEDPYLRERRSDVEFVFERVLRSLLGRETGPVQPPPDAIVAPVRPVTGVGVGCFSPIEPFPSWPHGIMRGIRVHGVWLDTRATCANTGRRWAFDSSWRCKAPSTYWSGMEA